jgi:outer membrane lipoprotein-sorting protein
MALMNRVVGCMIAATLAAISCGCRSAVTNTTRIKERPIAREATKEELLERYNAMAEGVKTLNATVELRPTAGSKYSGVIEEYHEVKAFLLAARPEQIRMIGQVAVIGKTVFDMASDGETFRVWIPSKNKFIVGSVAAERTSEKPIENLRPQHLVDALLWPVVDKAESVLLEEFNDENARYYVLTVLRGGYQTEILRKIWFDRADLQIARLETYGPKGALISDTRFANWQGVIGDQERMTGTPTGPNAFPMAISVTRPHDDYKLELQVLKVMLNQEIPGERFKLELQAGAEIVRVGESAEKKQP